MPRYHWWFEKARISVDMTLPLAFHRSLSKEAPRPVGPGNVVAHWRCNTQSEGNVPARNSRFASSIARCLM